MSICHYIHFVCVDSGSLDRLRLVYTARQNAAEAWSLRLAELGPPLYQRQRMLAHRRLAKAQRDAATAWQVLSVCQRAYAWHPNGSRTEQVVCQ